MGPNNEFIISVVLIILGLPLMALFYKYLKLKYRYFESKGNKYSVMDIFQPRFIKDSSQEAEEINNITSWLIFSMIVWGITMILLAKKFS